MAWEKSFSGVASGGRPGEQLQGIHSPLRLLKRLVPAKARQVGKVDDDATGGFLEKIESEIGDGVCRIEPPSVEGGGNAPLLAVQPETVVTSEEIREALREPLEAILNCVKTVIEQCKPELVSDLGDHGLVLTGGGALLRGLDSLMNEQIGIPVRVAEEPLTTVVRGTSICLEHLSQWRDSLDSGDTDF